MCVICVKKADVSLPDEARLREMFVANPDGAGFMYVRDQKVIVRKGFMKFKHLMKALGQEQIKNDDVVVFHFRVATAGSVKAGNCHPFPISESLSNLRAQRIETDMAMAHNGIINYERDKENDLSDTMSFVRDIMADEAIRKHLYEAAIFTLIEMGIGSSKLIILNKDKQFIFMGEWCQDKVKNDGLLYSNLFFRNSRTTHKNGYWDRENGGWVDDYILGTTVCETTYPKVDTKDLDKAVYENRAEHFGRTIAENMEFITREETKCPRCGKEQADTHAWFCRGCGVTLYRMNESVI